MSRIRIADAKDQLADRRRASGSTLRLGFEASGLPPKNQSERRESREEFDGDVRPNRDPAPDLR